MVPFVVKRSRNFRGVYFCAILFMVAAQVFAVSTPSVVLAQQTDSALPSSDFGARANAATDRIADSLGSRATYDLRYRLEEGQSLSWKVEHVTTTKTQISGTTEEASARVETLSTWNVTDVNKSNGQMVFTNSIEAVKAWKKVGEDEPTTYDSRTAVKAPDEYASLAETLGEQRSRITIEANGEVLDRQSEFVSTDFSTGDVTIPLPKEPIAIRHRWNVPLNFQSSNEHGAKVNLKARRCYEFRKVKDGRAYISFRTEVLTPIKSHTVRSKILQKMIKGMIVWDIAKGLPVQKHVHWDEKVQAYNGADSFLKYVGRMTVKLVDSQELAEVEAVKREQTFVSLQPLKIATVKLRLRNERPELRR